MDPRSSAAGNSVNPRPDESANIQAVKNDPLVQEIDGLLSELKLIECEMSHIRSKETLVKFADSRWKVLRGETPYFMTFKDDEIYICEDEEESFQRLDLGLSKRIFYV